MLPAKAFYLIRHGESEANKAQIAAGGGIDSPLTEKGQQQAKDLAPLIASLEVQPTVIHHSAMQRAADTARYINDGLGLDMTGTWDLREHDIGDWEGQPWAPVMQDINEKVEPPNGETYWRFAQRIQSAFTDVLESEDTEAPDFVPMIVCHGGVFHAMGLLYEYGISEIQNCHLHYYEPHPEYGEFPWKVSVFDIEDGKLVKKPANFCLSQALEDII
ncbi:MAG: histidine phosphatase family protein [Alphaproteobacteria bacterium]|jgi:broad specificity phosphatase PhoE|nr:histidine phosphatase family protein [Alphaproteobacteria bacterium]MDP7222819.1 histidine phosphatase family protein [Alphaproteobacteria bacterium]